MSSNTDGNLQVGEIVEYEGKPWRVGLVNFSRARLDSLIAVKHTIVSSGVNLEDAPQPQVRTFESFGSSVSIGPTSLLRRLTPAEIAALNPRRLDQLGDETMSEENAVSAAPIPVRSRKATNGSGKAVKVVKKDAGPKVEKPCTCGCGEKTTAFFVPGHDARFKGWLLQIERGKATPEQLLPKKVRESYTWKKAGKGLIPTKNYRGETHKGYDAD